MTVPSYKAKKAKQIYEEHRKFNEARIPTALGLPAVSPISAAPIAMAKHTTA